jgi:VanZ family protein
LRLLFWSASLFALVMALLPRPPELPGEPDDKVQHIIAFAVLACLARVAYRGANPLVLLGGLSLFGAVIELLQTIPILHRDGDAVDWLADTASAVLVLAAFRLFGRRWTHGQ